MGEEEGCPQNLFPTCSEEDHPSHFYGTRRGSGLPTATPVCHGLGADDSSRVRKRQREDNMECGTLLHKSKALEVRRARRGPSSSSGQLGDPGQVT